LLFAGALVAGIALFGVANALSAVTHSTGPLIDLRILAGVGAALIMPATLHFRIQSVCPVRRR
jgi:predicted MFS family arabinose efflux permease